MRLISIGAAMLVATALASCGGGSGCEAGTSPITGATGCGTTVAGAAKAERLVIQLSKTSATNSGADSVIATATATSTGGQTVSGVPVSFTVDANALYTASGTSTDAKGVVTATVSIGNDRSNRVVTVTAASGGLTASAAFQVTGSKLSGTAVPAIAAPASTGNKVNFRLTDANDNPIAGQAISVSAGSAGSASGVTGTNGDFAFTYAAPAASGSLAVEASAGGISTTQTVLIQSASTVAPVTTPILSASVSANPLVVSTNSPGTNNQVQVRALFLGANNAPIPNVRVRFDKATDTNSVGGAFSTDFNIVYSDANGVATAAYIPAGRSSPTNGLTIRACYDSADFAVNTCPKSTIAAITVVAEPLSVTIGSDEKVGDGPSGLTYIANFVVLVVDASGKAKANVAVEPAIDLVTYFKGFYIRPADASAWTLAGSATCSNEDINRNGVLEASEDVNHSGSIEPRKSDVAVSVVGSASTDATGIVKLQIEYPKNIGSWAIAKITVGAGVSGTEGRATWTERLRVPDSAIKAATAPAFIDSPYGLVFYTTTPLADVRGVVQPKYPDGTSATAASVVPCNNPY